MDTMKARRKPGLFCFFGHGNDSNHGSWFRHWRGDGKVVVPKERHPPVVGGTKESAAG